MFNSIKFYCKKNCSPCDLAWKLLEPRFIDGKVEKIELDTDEQVLEIAKKYNICSVPFIVINDRSVIYGNDIFRLLYSIHVCPKNT